MSNCAAPKWDCLRQPNEVKKQSRPSFQALALFRKHRLGLRFRSGDCMIIRWSRGGPPMLQESAFQRPGTEEVSSALPDAVSPSAVLDDPSILSPFTSSRARRWMAAASLDWVRSDPLQGRRFRVCLAQEVEHGRAFLFAPVLVAAGAATWFTSPVDPAPQAVFTLFLLFFLLCAVGQWRLGRIPAVSLAAVLILSGGMLAQWETWRADTLILDSPVTTTVTGMVYRREAVAGERWRYVLDVAGTAEPAIKRPPERVVLLVRSDHQPFSAGDQIVGRARLSPPSGPALPNLNDFAFSAFYDRIGAVGFFYGSPTRVASVDKTPRPAGWRQEVEGRIFALRTMIAERIRSIVPGDPGAFAAAIVTDERRAISKETTEALRVSGLAHIVAISGLNMALAAGIFFVGLRSLLGFFTGFAQAWPVKKIAAFGALLMATAYYLISGFAVSAERAYLMMSVMLIAVFFDRAAISLRNIAISALVILAVSPSEIMGPSFQMSFAATIALVAGYSLWSHRAANREPEPIALAAGRLSPVLTGWKFMMGIFVTSLIGGLSTAIYAMDHFQRLAGYGLAANLAVMPIISFIVMPAGLVGMLLMPFGLETLFLKLMGAGLEAVIYVAKYIAAWGGDVVVGRQHPWFLATTSAGFLLLALLKTRLRLIGLPVIAVGFLLSWHQQRQPGPDLLVSDDGSLVAVVGTAPATNRTRPPSFIFDQWQRVHELSNLTVPQFAADGDVEPPPTSDPRQMLNPQQLVSLREAMRSDLEATDRRSGSFLCRRKLWCVATTKEAVKVVTLEDARMTGLGCDLAQIVVAPRARFEECRSGALLITGKALRKTGALEIHLNGSADPAEWRANAAMVGKDRPWTRHRFYDWRSDQFDTSLPQALSALINGSGE